MLPVVNYPVSKTKLIFLMVVTSLTKSDPMHTANPDDTHSQMTDPCAVLRNIREGGIIDIIQQIWLWTYLGNDVTVIPALCLRGRDFQ